MIYALYSKNKWTYPVIEDFVDAKGTPRTAAWLRTQSVANLAKVGVFPVEEVQAVPPRGAVSEDSILEFVDGKLRVTPKFRIDANLAKSELLAEADKAHLARCDKGLKVGSITYPFRKEDLDEILTAREALTGATLTNLSADPVCNIFLSNGKVHLVKLSEIKNLFERLADAYLQSRNVLADQYEAAGVARFRSVVIEAIPPSDNKPVTEPPVITPDVQPQPLPQPVPPPVVKPGPVYEIVDDETHAFSGYVNSRLRQQGSTKFFDTYVNVAGNDYARAVGPFASPAEESLIANARALLPAGTAYDIAVTRYDSV